MEKINSWRQQCISRIYATKCRLNQKKYEGFGGTPSVGGGLGPGPPVSPLKSGPVFILLYIKTSVDNSPGFPLGLGSCRRSGLTNMKTAVS